MQFRYDDDFIEAAVYLCASGRRRGVPAMQIRRFHAERERCYVVLDPDERNTAFFKVHLSWFREWGLEELLLACSKEYPILEDHLSVLAFRQARSKNEEGSELYVTDDARNGLLALRIERFEDDERLSAFLRHELMHLRDMVDPAFRYSPRLQLENYNPTQQRITRERYRLLWDITIDGRLCRKGALPVAVRQQHEHAFNRAFSFWPDAKRGEVFVSHWENDSPSHQELMVLAADPRNLSAIHEPVPGASCPLCGFPTFEWVDRSMLGAEVIGSIAAQFPHWSPEQGTCKRCLEIYEVAGRFEVPATMVL